MDRLNPTEQSVLAEFTELAETTFGRSALFMYVDRETGEATTADFSQAMQICGQYIARVSSEQLLERLHEMRNRAITYETAAQTSAAIEARFEQTIERGRQKVAQHAIESSEAYGR